MIYADWINAVYAAWRAEDEAELVILRQMMDDGEVSEMSAADIRMYAMVRTAA